MEKQKLLSAREKEILSFIKKQGTAKQPKIVSNFQDNYKSRNSARSMISRALKNLRDKDQIELQSKEPTGDAGLLDINIWKAKN